MPRTLHLPRVEQGVEPKEVTPMAIEKPSQDAVISVVISLPTGEIKLGFRKRNVAGNSTASQLSASNFERAFRGALEKLLGSVDKV